MAKTKKTKTLKITPLGAWVLVKPDKNEEITEGGLYTPAAVEQDEKSVGEVIAVGDDVEVVQKGWTVLFGKYAGEDIQDKLEHNQKRQVDYKLLLEEDILGRTEWV